MPIIFLRATTLQLTCQMTEYNVIAVILVPLKLLKGRVADAMNNSTIRTSFITSIATSITKTDFPTITTKTSSTTNAASTTKTVFLTKTTTTPAATSSLCTDDSDKSLFDNEFLYSPTSQTYATGLLNGQFGVYKTDGYGNVTSTSIWLAEQKSKLGVELKLQRDRSLIVYAPGVAIWGSGTHNGGDGGPFCLVISDMGHLRWINAKKEILWKPKELQYKQTNICCPQ
ncbi:unnamed protein product [Adineta ricciae]|uniref:Bulb-type lectin domain-containing protein n=1 Tax=Adineta ricciae TaxID=249248 RepID=A0A815TLX0_ADIRI|nr:unnamed protein product [Adineta ricciae]